MPAASKEMRYWIDVALECARRDHTPSFSRGDQLGPFLTARALGMALGALHDAHVLSGAKLLGFSVPAPPAPSGTSTIAAAEAYVAGAAACHQVLLHRYPAQTAALNVAWDFWLALYPIPAAANRTGFETYGRRVGDAIHLLGLDDRRIAATDSYVPSGAYSHDVPPHEPRQGFAGAAWGTVNRLISTAIAGFPPPPGRTGTTPASVNPSHPHLVADFRKVQVTGANAKRARTDDQEVVGIFWGYDGPAELGTPPRLYLQVVLAVLDEVQAARPGGLSADEELKIAAAAALAMADAGIDAWHYKYSPNHMMWRPVLGIRHGLGGPVPGEPNWLPLGRPDTNGEGEGLTPNFPAYPSGHATFGAAAFHLLRTFLVHKGVASHDATGRDDVRFCFVSDEFNGRNRDPRLPRAPRPHLLREYDSLWDAIIDNSVSRVYLGVHWQFDGVTAKGADADGEFGLPAAPDNLGKRGGVWLGCQLANQIALSKLGVTAGTIANLKA